MRARRTAFVRHRGGRDVRGRTEGATAIALAATSGSGHRDIRRRLRISRHDHLDAEHVVDPGRGHGHGADTPPSTSPTSTNPPSTNLTSTPAVSSAGLRPGDLTGVFEHWRGHVRSVRPWRLPERASLTIETTLTTQSTCQPRHPYVRGCVLHQRDPRRAPHPTTPVVAHRNLRRFGFGRRRLPIGGVREPWQQLGPGSGSDQQRRSRILLDGLDAGTATCEGAIVASGTWNRTLSVVIADGLPTYSFES